MSDGYKALLFAIVVLLFLVILPSVWLIRRWRGRRRKERDFAELLGRPYSGPATFRFRFDSAHRDLLDAHGAFQPSGPGDRFVLVVLGVFWLGCVLVCSPRSIRDVTLWKDGAWWRLLLMLGLGTAVIWFNLVKPLLERRRIRRENASIQPVSLEFSDSGIHIESPGVGALDRTWAELQAVKLADKGIAVVLTGTTNWIPNRAFSSEDQRRSFAAFLMNKMPREPEGESE